MSQPSLTRCELIRYTMLKNCCGSGDSICDFKFQHKPTIAHSSFSYSDFIRIHAHFYLIWILVSCDLQNVYGFSLCLLICDLKKKHYCVWMKWGLWNGVREQWNMEYLSHPYCNLKQYTLCIQLTQCKCCATVHVHLVRCNPTLYILWVNVEINK